MEEQVPELSPEEKPPILHPVPPGPWSEADLYAAKVGHPPPPPRVKRRYTLFKIIVATVCAGGILYLSLFYDPGTKGVGWADNLETALVRAQEENKVVLIYFSALDSHQHEVLQQTLLNDPAGPLRRKKTIQVLIDAPSHRRLVKQFQIQSLPFFLLLNAYGVELARHEGLLVSYELEAWLAKHLDKKKDTPPPPKDEGTAP